VAALPKVRLLSVHVAGEGIVMPGVLPCWLVDVRHERRSGKLGHFVSTPLTLTQAWRLLRKYEATGTPASLRCIEDLAHLHRLMIRGELGRAEAIKCAKNLGYNVE
jgi:hypothetical protein